MESLLPFQRADVDKLKHCTSVLIANEPGTGKTYEGIALDSWHRKHHSGPEDQTLVIAPLTVLDSWREHFEKLTDLKVRVVNPKRRSDLLSEYADAYVVHYDALRLMPQIAERRWLHVIADEAHRIKNRKAQQTKALKKIPTIYRTALTGTPVVNRPDELWSILNWLYYKDYKAYWKWYGKFVDYEVLQPHGYHVIKGPKNVELLQSQIEPFFVRRLKKDVLLDLPDKYYTELKLDLHPAQRKAYDQMKKEDIAWVGENEDQPLAAPVVIARLIRLQQFAVAYAEVLSHGVCLAEPSSKLDAAMQIIGDNPGQQIVFFTQFRQLVDLFEKRLINHGVSYGRITGNESAGVRQHNVEAFQRGDKRVIIGTIAAGGIGITLTAASTVVFLDRSWSPAINLQAEDRLHRIGQPNAVQVIDLIARNTVDLGRQQRLIQKWSWIREILGDK